MGKLLLVVALGLLLVTCSVRISVVDGESMAPSIRSGDIVMTISLPSQQVSVGNILLVSEGGRRLLHRLRVIDGDRLWMQGDASVSSDSRPVRRSDVLGHLALVIPTSHIFHALRAAARFTDSRLISISLASGGGAVAELSPRSTVGADAQGRLRPGGHALWSIALSACGASGSSCAANYALRLDSSAFAALLPPVGGVGDASQALARALRIATRCQPLSGGAWTEASDRFTGEWSATDLTSGLLVQQSGAAVRSGVRCEVRATLLGVPAAGGGSVELPLLWGPA
ncbi:MAG: S24/S26 family peptidase [Chloroflexi bacterium]|nr:S24/S26 family peptidase [Chloroflexota bacterium]